MALVTETTLREQFKDGNFPKCYVVPAGVIVTPSARAWLVDHRIDLTIGDAPRIQPAVASPASTSALPAFTKPDHFDVIDGSEIVEKPEHLTALRGNLLVPKDHPQIRFRGQIDALEADILVAQVAFQRLGLPTGVADLGEVLRYVKQILRCEVLDLPFDGGKLFGMDEGKLRQLSHHPQETFGIPHFAASVEDGEAVVLLNQLRTKVRQVELAAYDAFSAGGVGPPSRVDLIQALNRLSSAIYIMMFKAKVKDYQ
ncbi:MAG: hypothetical protein FWD80_03915 [Propionibacteriaceae bacterium]|nr:hypothetical protein [Propionibacteriaceae bacterium]